MVDRIDKLDPTLHRIQETNPDQERGEQEPEEEDRKKKEKDKFDKGRPTWKKVIHDGEGGSSTERRTIWGGKEEVLGTPPRGTLIPETALKGSGETDESSLSLSQRVLVLWGVLDLQGRPRVAVIITYGVVLSLISFSAVLLLGILWR